MELIQLLSNLVAEEQSGFGRVSIDRNHFYETSSANAYSGVSVEIETLGDAPNCLWFNFHHEKKLVFVQFKGESDEERTVVALEQNPDNFDRYYKLLVENQKEKQFRGQLWARINEEYLEMVRKGNE